MKTKRNEKGDVDSNNVCCYLAATIAEFVEKECKEFAYLLIVRYFRASKLGELDPPSLKEDTVHGDNAKSELQTTITDNWATAAQQLCRRSKEVSRAERQFLRNGEEVQEVRRTNTKTGNLLLCDASCPITNRFCRKEFHSKEALCQHQ